MEDLRGFLTRVLPWPDPEGGFINLHTHLPGGPFDGVAVQTVDAFMQEVEKALPRKRNLYFCLSQQREAKPNGSGLHAVRNTLNATFLKSIWFDIDVGPDKAYQTTKQALGALTTFTTDANLPGPTAIVASGSGGLHVYWSSDRPLIRGVWEQYANGLRGLAARHKIAIDAKCTIDAARVLRIPGTLNYKHNPPRDVTLLGLGKEYDFASALPMVLAAGGKVSQRGVSPTPAGGLPALPARFAGRKDAIVVDADTLPPQQGPLIVSPLPVLQGCPFFKRAFDTGGKGFPEPLWYQSLRVASYMEHGEKIAHVISKGDDRYSPGDTTRKWQYALEQQEKLGWPTCAGIQREGCGDCATCPHLGKIKSPLSLAIPALKKATLPAKVDNSGWRLPPLFRLKDNNIEYYLVPKKQGGDGGDGEGGDDDHWQPFIRNELVSRPWAQKSPDGIMLNIRIDVASTREVFIPRTDFPKMRITQKMQDVGLWYNWRIQPTIYEGFFMDWVGKMNSYVPAHEKSVFGWEWKDKGSKIPTAFVYGGYRFKNDGTREPVGAVDEKMRSEYYPEGKREAWDDAMKVIFDQKRPGLELIVAATLAGPLVALTGVEGCMLSVYSTSSGAHKSTASKLGAAMFGHPLRSRETKGTSAKGALKRAGDLQHLTVQFDDLQEDKELLTAVHVATQLSQGNEGTKLNQARGYASKGEWQTFAMTLSNQSVIEFMARKEPNTSAPMNRVFEVYHAKQDKQDPGLIDELVATRLIGDLNRNYGHVGLQYAELLANNAKAVYNLVESETAEFRASLAGEGIEPDSANRYWVVTCSTLLVAAKLGREMKIPFDYDGIRTRLLESFVHNVGKRTDEAVEGEYAQNAEMALTDYLNKACPAFGLWSQDAAQKGGDRKDRIKLLGTPPHDRKEIRVHLVTGARSIRISRKEFKIALREDGRNIDTVVRGLVKHFNANTKAKYSLGAGSDYVRGQERTVEIPVPPGSPWEGILFAHGGHTDEQL